MLKWSVALVPDLWWCSTLFSAARFSVFSLPRISLAHCALFLALVFVGLFALILAYVFFANYPYPLFITNLSSSGRDPRARSNTLHVLTSLGVNQQRSFSPASFHINGVWDAGTVVR